MENRSDDIEIVFLESELVEDDAEAPVGVLIKAAAENGEKPDAKAESEVIETQTASALPDERSLSTSVQADEAAADVATAEAVSEQEIKPEPAEENIWKVASVTAQTTSEPIESKPAETQSNNLSEENKPQKSAKKPTAAKTSSAKKETGTATKSQAAVKKESAPSKSKSEPDKAQSSAKTEVKKSESAERVLEAGNDAIPHGKFVIKKTEKGNFVYKLYSFNHRVVAIGAEQYGSLASCKQGIASVRTNAENAPVEDQTLQKWEEKKCPKWQIYTDKKGEIRFRLIASNGNIVATTNDGYLSKGAAKKGIDAIARASNGAAVVRNDTLW